MLIDTATILQGVNLKELILRDAEEANGNRAWCPLCQNGSSDGNHTPAMSIRDTRYFCFGCGASGDAIDYIMRRNNVQFQEACRILGWDGNEVDQQELIRTQAARQQQRERENATRAAELDAVLSEYSTEEIWKAFNRRLTEEHRAWWVGRGISVEWQNYLQLGYIPDKTYIGKSGVHLHSPAYTIPYFHTGYRFQTMQYRLHNPERPQDRYRFEHGLKASYYQVTPSEEIGEYAIICEGAIKSIVTQIYGGTGERVSLLAVPGRDTFGGIANAVKHCRRVWVVLDPDCWTKPENAPPTWEPAPIKLSKLIGPVSRIVRLPGKVDDMLLEGMTGESWKAALKGATQ
jgi:hypothetical protein